MSARETIIMEPGTFEFLRAPISSLAIFREYFFREYFPLPCPLSISKDSKNCLYLTLFVAAESQPRNEERMTMILYYTRIKI